MPVLFAHLAARALDSASTISGDAANQRSLWDILWSCAVTIFACTWIAVHPNVPAADDPPLVIAFRRAGLMLCGMVAPELIILWAMRQWYSARKIGQKHKGKGWTTAHGFFLQMGGFEMHDGANAPYPIQLDDLVARHAKGEIEWPLITEREIQDRSKGDAFSKGVVVFQTSWFVIQCIGRGATGLAITELELVTLAFAALNAVTYYFWWNKPADVQCAYPIYPRGPQGYYAKYNNNHTKPQSVSPKPHSLSRAAHFVWSWLKPILPPFYEIYQRGSPFAHMFSYIQRPVTLLMKFFVRIVLPMTGKMHDFTAMRRVPTFYAARFEADATRFLLMTLACALVGSAFGGIHCIAWSFQFTSEAHRVVWRTSSLVITCAPMAIALGSTHMSHQNRIYKRFITPVKYRSPISTLASFSTPLGPMSFEVTAANTQPDGFTTPYLAAPEPIHTHINMVDVVNRATSPNLPRPPIISPVKFDSYMIMVLRAVVWSIKCILLAGITAAYIAARVILVVQALMALKALSPSELQDMEWTNFIPHV